MRNPERVREFVNRKLSYLENNNAHPRNAHNTVQDLIGLKTMHTPPEPLIDLVFVHGLSGGSHRTWTRSGKRNYFWPEMWLPNDPGFKHVRISTYGYQHVASDDRVFNISEIATRLLSEMTASPLIKDSPKVCRLAYYPSTCT